MADMEVDPPEVTKTDSELHREVVSFLQEVDPNQVREIEEDDRLEDALATAASVLEPAAAARAGHEQEDNEEGEGC